jgi:hypothetical protein
MCCKCDDICAVDVGYRLCVVVRILLHLEYYQSTALECVITLIYATDRKE